MPLASLRDIERIEKTPLEARALPSSTYELIRRSAERFPDAIAIELLATIDANQTITVSYAEFFRKVTQTAHLLRSLGVAANDTVSVLLPNLPHTHYVIWAAQAVGIVHPVNTLFKASQIADVMRAVNTRVLVALGPAPKSELWRSAIEACQSAPSVEAIVVVDLQSVLQKARNPAKPHIDEARSGFGTRVQVLDFDASVDPQPVTAIAAPTDRESARVVACLNTGGTTGAPKLAQWTNSNQVYSAWAMAFIRDMGPTDSMLCGLPMYHANAILAGGLAIFAAGARVVFLTPDGYRDKEVMPNLWKFVERFRASGFGGVPTVYARLLEQLDSTYDISSLRFCGCGAAPMPTELFHRFEAATGARILEGYGLTEGTCASAVNPPDGERRIGSVGLRFPYQRIRIVELHGDGHITRDCAVDEAGIVLISGPSVFAGYKHHINDVKVFPAPGWLNTGDLGRLDADGYLWLSGRAKDLIIRGGHNIDPLMIENILMKHPAVAMVAAVGQPDAYAGELPVAFVTLRGGARATPDEILAFARAAIRESGAAPVRVEILGELPLTTIGKVFKPALRESAAAYAAREVLRKGGLFADINAHTHPRDGLIVTVQHCEPTDRPAITKALGTFAFRTCFQ